MSEFSSPDLISAYADNQLSDQERQEVDALLERSPEARAELESYRKLGSLLKNLPEQQAGSDLARRVLAQAEQESLLGKSIPSSEINTTPDSTSNRRWAISMAAFLATAALLFLAITQFQPPANQESLVATNESSADASRSVTEMDLLSEEKAMAELSEAEVPLSGAGLAELMEGPDRISIELGNNGLMKLINPQNLKTAEIGDTVEGWRFDEDRVVVVQLTVVDRDQVLNSMQVLLSDLSIPYESGDTNSVKDENGDFYAVYVEADTEKMTTALRELQEDMNIEEMLVSAKVDSDDLNPYFKEQGYAFINSGELNKTKSVARMSIPAEPAAVPVKPSENQPISDPQNEKKMENLSASSPKSKFDRNKNSIVTSLPPAPPLPEDKLTLSLAKSASPEFYRQVQLRLPEAVANQMLYQQPTNEEAPLGQSSVLNSFATERAEELDKAAGAGKPDIPALAKKLTDQKESTLKRRSVPKESPIPVQVLFVFTPEQKLLPPASKVPDRK